MAAPRLAVISGRGALPGLALAACTQRGWPCLAVSFAGVEDVAIPDGFEHIEARFERLGEMFARLTEAEVGVVVFAGGMERPHLDPAACDPETLAILPELVPYLGMGDDATLRAVASIFETRGFAVKAVHDLIAGLVASEGVMGRVQPSEDDLADAASARRIARALGAEDVGQGAVVAQGICLGAETIQGTDAMLQFVAETAAGFRPDPNGARGVLWKGPKPGQDLRLDMPAIGPETVRRAALAGLAGIAVAAGGTLVLDRAAVIRAADKAGLFLIGLSPE